MSIITTSPILFDCDVCGERHELPLNLGFSMPDFVNKLLPWERDKRCQMSPDWCIADDRYYYLRGCLDLTIENTGSVFSWGVWTTVSEADFDRTMELWNEAARQSEPPYTGNLANSMPLCGETRNLKAKIQTRGVGERPAIIIDDPAHSLYAQQQTGMPLAAAIELAKLVLHGQASNPWLHLCER